MGEPHYPGGKSLDQDTKDNFSTLSFKRYAEKLYEFTGRKTAIVNWEGFISSDYELQNKLVIRSWNKYQNLLFTICLQICPGQSVLLGELENQSRGMFVLTRAPQPIQH